MASETPSSIGETPPRRPAATEADLPEFPFLDPPRSAGELGWFSSRYRIVGRLGSGGMGLVLLAEDQTLGRRVALKLLHPHWVTQEEARTRFLNEARAMARHQHSRIVPIYDTGLVKGVPYLTMPLLEGESLQTRLERLGALAVPEALRLARETAEGLSVAHQSGQIHRDIKPSNLWLCPPEPEATDRRARLVLLDFGLAREIEQTEPGRLTRTGVVRGTPGYMAPEQGSGAAIDGRADVFSLGVVLYEMLTGEQPFAADSLTEILIKVSIHAPPAPAELRPGLPTELSALVLRLLEKDPSRRPTIDTVIDRLRELEASLPNEPLARSARETARGKKTEPDLGTGPRTAGRRWLIPLALFLLAGGLVAGIASLAGWPRTLQPPELVSQGYVDVLLAEKQGTAVRLHLGDFGALPVVNGDRFRIEAHVDVPAYLYLFWITCEGEAVPVYPWQPGKWGTRPETEGPRTELELPTTTTRGYRFSGEATGMESLLLLARPTRLEADDATVRGWFANLSPQRTLADPRAAVWFFNGRVASAGPRTRHHFDTEDEINNTTLQLQELLRARLSEPGNFTAAVCFAKLAH